MLDAIDSSIHQPVGEEYKPGPIRLRHIKHSLGSADIDHHEVDRVPQIRRRRERGDRMDHVLYTNKRRPKTLNTRKVLEIQGLGNVVPDEFKMWMREQMVDIALMARRIVIHANNIVRVHEILAEIRSQKSRTAGHQHVRALLVG